MSTKNNKRCLWAHRNSLFVTYTKEYNISSTYVSLAALDDQMGTEFTIEFDADEPQTQEYFCRTLRDVFLQDFEFMWAATVAGTTDVARIQQVMRCNTFPEKQEEWEKDCDWYTTLPLEKRCKQLWTQGFHVQFIGKYYHIVMALGFAQFELESKDVMGRMFEWTLPETWASNPILQKRIIHNHNITSTGDHMWMDADCSLRCEQGCAIHPSGQNEDEEDESFSTLECVSDDNSE
jgi:hypothetical protein